MPSLTMNGPFDIDHRIINEVIPKRLPGNYALGNIKSEGAFVVKYIGRSDHDINAEIKNCIVRFGRTYTKFKFSYAGSDKAAFEKECQNFHDFGGTAKLNNTTHPSSPPRTKWKCPFCNV